MPIRDSPDPLAAALQPPSNESPEDKLKRLADEAEARRISHEIDEDIKREKALRKKAKIVKLLLLGQSESGKSTTLRQFQRLYTPSAFRDERVLWRSVIQLNIVRSVRLILDCISDVRRHELPVSSASEGSDDESVRLPFHLETITMRLLPLRHIESLLIAKLVPPNEDEATHLGLSGMPMDYLHQVSAQTSHNSHRSQREIFVRPGATWKGGMLQRARNHVGAGRPQSAGITGQETQDESQAVLNQCRDDMIALWNDPTVRDVLRKRKVRLEESPGFYLNDLPRLTALDYCPSDEDVFKARLKTVGVCEYRFEMEAGFEVGTEWRIIDVGGSRSQRPTWVPFFDDVDAIIFLAPISAFDQTLVEDKSVNRLEDSVMLWKAVCSNKLLEKVELILFMNKCDILDQKLRSGIRLAKYLRSFGDRPNDLENAQKFFRSKFSYIHREHSPQPRRFHCYFTSVTDTSTTSGILASVRDMVMREHLRKAKLLS